LNTAIKIKNDAIDREILLISHRSAR